MFPLKNLARKGLKSLDSGPHTHLSKMVQAEARPR